MLILAIADLRELVVAADVAAAMSVEALLGHRRGRSPRTCTSCGPQAGQARAAAHHPRLLDGSDDRRQPPRAGGHARPGRLLAALRPAWSAAPRATRSTTPRRSPTASSRSAIDNPVVHAGRPRRVERQLPRRAARPTSSTSWRSSAADLGEHVRAPHRSLPRRLPQPRPAALPRRRSGRRLRAHDRPVHAGGDRVRHQAPGRARERRLDPDLGDAGGSRVHGLERGTQAAPRRRRASARCWRSSC